MTTTQIITELKKYSSPERAKGALRFFKTGPGQYGEGDLFYGATVPESRIIAKKYSDTPIEEIQKLLENQYHECRLIALYLLIDKYEKAKSETEKKKYFDIYLKNTKYINNWDLVDTSAHKIVGAYLYDYKKDRKILYKLAKSNNLWEKRISIISTYYFIKKDDFMDTLNISEVLLQDKHDLMHKAVGWMLRELGKRNQDIEEQFLKKFYKHMPRTMLRYSIERFDSKKKEFYMKK